MGDRPMASPHVQANTQMYNSYHQSNCQSQAQQQCNQNMNYFNTNGNSNQQPNNSAITNEVDQRRSIERLAAISHPPEMYVNNNPRSDNLNTTTTQTSSINPLTDLTYYNKTPTVPHDSTSQAPQITTDPPVRKNTQTVKPELQATPAAAVVSSSNEVHQQDATKQCQDSKQSTAVEESGVSAQVPVNVTCVFKSSEPSVTTSSDLLPVSKTDSGMSHAIPHEDLEQKHRETAADSGIDSEQVDTHPEEENDTSTTSNRSENSPTPADKSSVADTQEAASENGESLCNNSDKQSSVFSPRSEQETCDEKEERLEEKVSPNDDKDSLASKPPVSSSLDDSFSCLSPGADVFNNSFSSTTSASRQSNSDESRLPPRKRKLQQLAEQLSGDNATSVPLVAMPPKKRGRPTKEAVRLREAAKAAEAARLAEAAKQSEISQPEISVGKLTNVDASKSMSTQKNPLKLKQKKERKHSTTVPPENLSKPVVHSGVLLQTPKLSLEGMSSPMFKTEEQVKEKEKKKSVGDTKSSYDNTHTKKLSVSPGSNAVRVSPPKRPKASVSEMQKALMRAVSNDNSDVNAMGKKRKRGRPPGTKNRRTKFLEQRNRSNSTGSNSRWPLSSTSTAGDAFGTASSPMCQRLSTPTNYNALTVATDSTYSQQSHELPASVQVPELPMRSRKSSSVSPKPNHISAFELKLPVTSDQWMCTFCHQITNYHDMGDLYGGYNVKPETPVTLKNLNYKKASEIRQITLDSNGRAPNEVWFHEKCVIWSPGVYMVAGKLYGLYEALATAFQTVSNQSKIFSPQT